MHPKIKHEIMGLLEVYGRKNYATDVDSIARIAWSKTVPQLGKKTLEAMMLTAIKPLVSRAMRQPAAASPIAASLQSYNPDLFEILSGVPWWIAESEDPRAKRICILWASIEQLIAALQLRERKAEQTYKKADNLQLLVDYLRENGYKTVAEALGMEKP